MDKNEITVIDTWVAATWWQRARGLLGRPVLAPAAGMLFPRTASVHGFGMRHALDLVFVDAHGRVMKCCRLPRWSVRLCRGASAVLEMRVGEIARLGIQPGQQLMLRHGRDIFEPSRQRGLKPSMSLGTSCLSSASAASNPSEILEASGMSTFSSASNPACSSAISVTPSRLEKSERGAPGSWSVCGLVAVGCLLGNGLAASAAHAAQAAQQVQALQPLQPAQAVKPATSVRAAQSVRPVQLVKSQSVKSAKAVRAGQPMRSAQSVKSVRSVRSVQHFEPGQHAQSVQAVLRPAQSSSHMRPQLQLPAPSRTAAYAGSPVSIDQALAEAERLYQAQQDEEALSLFHSIAELSARHREQALFRMGNLHQRRGEKGLALRAYGRLMEVSMQAEVEAGTWAGETSTSSRQSKQLHQASQLNQANHLHHTNRQKGGKPHQQDARTAQIVRQARQLKAMINANLMAVEQSHQSLAWIEQLQQDPEVRAAAGLDLAVAARISQQLGAQSEQINQLMVRLGAWDAQSLNRAAHRPSDRPTHAWAPPTALPLGQANTRQRVTIVYDKPPRRAAKKAAAKAVPALQDRSTGVSSKPEILSGGGSQPNQAAPTSTSVPALTPTPAVEVKEENASSVPQILMPSKPVPLGAQDPSSTQGQPSTVGMNEKEADHG